MGEFSYTIIPSPDVAGRVDSALKGIAGALDRLRLPGLACVVLGGGYGRGEGGVLHTPDGDRLYNDLDFFVFSRGAGARARRRIDAETAGLAAEWSGILGVDVDFCRVKDAGRLRGVAGTLMYQELLRGWRPVWGRGELRDWIPETDAQAMPFSEAARLLLNRGMGLVFAGERLSDGADDPDFIVRNMNKAVMGSGDGMLLAAGEYNWSGGRRREIFPEFARRSGLPDAFAAAYEAAWRYKAEPRPELPPEPSAVWRDCRRMFMTAVETVAGAGAGASVSEVCAGLRRRGRGGRSFGNLLRCLKHRGGWRLLGMAFDAPVVSLLGRLYREMAAADGYFRCPADLYGLWKEFN